MVVTLTAFSFKRLSAVMPVVAVRERGRMADAANMPKKSIPKLLLFEVLTFGRGEINFKISHIYAW